MKKTLIFFGITSVFVLIIIGFNAWRSGMINGADLRALAARRETLVEPNAVRDGEVMCLPQKGTSPTLNVCIYGLKTVEGEYYELRNMERAGPEGTIQRGDELRVIGDIIVSGKRGLVDVTRAIQIERIQDLVVE